MSGTTSGNEWQRVTASNMSDKEWQRITASDNEWQRVTVVVHYTCTKRHSTHQRMDDCHPFNDKTDTLLLQGMDDCN